MTDAHFHRGGYPAFLETGGREFRFAGVHPWQTGAPGFAAASALDALRAELAGSPLLGVGECGLDRLRSKTVSASQREIFSAQLALAAEFRRPVAVHGAKCWGETVRECAHFAGEIPAFLFHGFSRSAGLLGEMVSLNGYFSAGPAILNEHAVNYAELVRLFPEDRILVESDMEDSPDRAGTVRRITSKTAELRGRTPDEFERIVSANAARFISSLHD